MDSKILGIEELKKIGFKEEVQGLTIWGNVFGLIAGKDGFILISAYDKGWSENVRGGKDRMSIPEIYRLLDNYNIKYSEIGESKKSTRTS